MRNKVAKAYAMTDVKPIFVSLVDKAANQRQFLLTKSQDGSAIFQTYGRILKADSEAHYVTGIVYEPMEEDTQGNYMTAEEIEKAQRWFAKNANSIDLQHNFEKMESAAVVENWIAKCDCQINGQDVKEGSWLMTVEVSDPGIYEAIEKGEITGFSMGGTGVYSNVDDDISCDEPVAKSGLNIFQKMAKAFTTPKPVQKGAVMENYKRTSIHDNFWNAYYALSDYLLDAYNPETGRWEIQTDEDVIRGALDDFNQIVTQLLTGNEPVVKALNAASVEKAAGAGKDNLNVLKSIYQNLGTFIEKSEEQEEMEVEITKAELETIVAGAVQKAMGTNQNAANPAPAAEGAANTNTGVQKDAGGCEGAGQPITAETIEQMVNAAIQKAVNPPQEPMTLEKAEEYINAAVAKALDPVLKSAGLPSNLNNTDNSVQKSAPQSHFMDGVFF